LFHKSDRFARQNLVYKDQFWKYNEGDVTNANTVAFSDGAWAQAVNTLAKQEFAGAQMFAVMNHLIAGIYILLEK
jgi:hypothetical protein